MPHYLLTVESVRGAGSNVGVLPAVSIASLIGREPDLIVPMPGDALELRLPSGTIRHASVASFGVESFLQDGALYTASDPSDPAFTLYLAGDLAGSLGPDDIPPGTEIWLP